MFLIYTHKGCLLEPNLGNIALLLNVAVPVVCILDVIIWDTPYNIYSVTGVLIVVISACIVIQMDQKGKGNPIKKDPHSSSYLKIGQ